LNSLHGMKSGQITSTHEAHLMVLPTSPTKSVPSDRIRPTGLPRFGAAGRAIGAALAGHANQVARQPSDPHEERGAEGSCGQRPPGAGYTPTSGRHLTAPSDAIHVDWALNVH